MSPPESATAAITPRRFRISLENRYLAPVFVTCILIVAHLSFGILESYTRTGAAIVTAVLAEIVLGRLTFGKWPHLASAYITGISVGMLIRSPLMWPYALGSLLSIGSKYALRVRGRHIWNPSNFGLSAMFFLAPAAVAGLSIQWGNVVLPMIVIWVLGTVIIWRVRRLHICATYVASFALLSLVRSAITGHPWLADLAPVTGPMYQLFIFFMITDPRTTVRSRRGQILTAFGVAVVEMALRLDQVVYAPFYALFLVGPAAMLIEMWQDAAGASRAAARPVRG